MPPSDFYSAASQIIPVLFLAMAFESKILSRNPDTYPLGKYLQSRPALWNGSQIIGVIALVILMAIGEGAALVALYAKGNPIPDALVWLGLGVGILGVVIPVWSRQSKLLREHVEDFEKEQQAGVRRYLIFVVFVTVAGTLALVRLFVYFTNTQY